MSVVPSEMPLLPMPAVLFPGTFLPVQISERSHREMVRECAEANLPLGILLNPGCSGTAVPHTTGCIASVALVLDGGEKDVMGAVLYGEQRMRVTQFRQQDPCVTGSVEVLEDYSGLNAERRTQQASKLFQRYLELVRQRYQAQVVNVPLPNDPILASYLLAAVLFLPLETKQRWLESASAALRLQEELAFLNTECDKLSVVLALSQHTQRQYAIPDYDRYLASQN